MSGCRILRRFPALCDIVRRAVQNLLLRQHRLDRFDGDLDHIVVRRPRRDVLELHPRPRKRLDDRIPGAARRADELVGDAGNDGEQHETARDALGEARPAEEGKDENRDEHDDEEKRRSAARMQARVPLDVFHRQHLARLKAVDRLVLRAVILKDALDVLRPPDRPDVDEEDDEAQHALHEI